MVDLLIVQPNTKGYAYPGMGDLPAVEPPLWARLIAGYCRDKGWRVAIYDAEALGANPIDITAEVNKRQPKLVVVMATGHQPSASTQAMPAVRDVCQSIKHRAYGSNTPILLIGGHVAALPERTLREEPCDYVCTGEGPVTVDALLRMLDPGSLQHGNAATVPDLGLLVQGKYCYTEKAPLLDVDQIHGDAWDLLPMERYRAHNWHCDDGRERTGYASIYTSLGCPYSCSFCCINAPFGKPSYRMRRPEDVAREVVKLRESYGVTNIKITDEMFVLNARHVKAICNLLAVHNGADDLNIWAYARVDTAARHADLLPLMRRAGVRWLALGIESADDAVMDGADKSFRKADAGDVVRTIQAAGIKVIGNFIFGLPGDTADSMERTYALAEASGCDFVNFYSAMAYPGSQLHREAISGSRAYGLPASWSGYAQHAQDCHPLPTETLTSAEVLAFRDRAQQRYFAARGLPDLARRLPRSILGDRAA